MSAWPRGGFQCNAIMPSTRAGAVARCPRALIAVAASSDLKLNPASSFSPIRGARGPLFLVTSSPSAAGGNSPFTLLVLIRVADSATVELETNVGEVGTSTDVDMNGRLLISRLDRQRRCGVGDGRRHLLEKLKRERLCDLLLGELFSPALMRLLRQHSLFCGHRKLL